MDRRSPDALRGSRLMDAVRNLRRLALFERQRHDTTWTPAERAAFDAKAAARKKAAEEERQRAAEAAQREAIALFGNARPADPRHRLPRREAGQSSRHPREGGRADTGVEANRPSPATGSERYAQLFSTADLFQQWLRGDERGRRDRRRRRRHAATRPRPTGSSHYGWSHSSLRRIVRREVSP